jgi:hypothetical protein
VVNDPATETEDGRTQNQALLEEIQAMLKEIFVWLQKDARDQIRDVDHFEEMLVLISQKLPEDIKSSLEPISGLDIHYVAIRRALKSQSTRPAIEQKRAKAEQAEGSTNPNREPQGNVDQSAICSCIENCQKDRTGDRAEEFVS